MSEENGSKNGASVKKRQAARLQVDPETVDADGKPPQTGTIFNIWYSKWAGGDSNDANLQTHSKTRVNIARDSGYTKADRGQSQGITSRGTPIFCLYFARGSCCMGKKCEYLHRLPTDDDRVPITQDCFGRDRFADYRDDMGGVGNFNKINKTLYIGRINNINDDRIELQVSQNFKEFGDIEQIRVIRDKNIAFVTYKNELNAQFAKEAMAHQSLDKKNENEILNIRWANEDPDPEARRRNKRKLEQESMEKVRNLVRKLEGDAEPQVEEVEEDEEEVGLEDETTDGIGANKDDDLQDMNSDEYKQPTLLQGSGAGALDLLRRLKAAKAQKTKEPQKAIVMYDDSSSEDE